MKLPRRAAAVLAAFLMAASLVITPQPGRAVPIKEPIDYVPTTGEGDPDVPYGVVLEKQGGITIFLGRLMIFRLDLYPMFHFVPIYFAPRTLRKP